MNFFFLKYFDGKSVCYYLKFFIKTDSSKELLEFLFCCFNVMISVMLCIVRLANSDFQTAYFVLYSLQYWFLMYIHVFCFQQISITDLLKHTFYCKICIYWYFKVCNTILSSICTICNYWYFKVPCSNTG